ncbi:MAG: fibronectin type III domain-containing protein [Bermanella sp.]
MRTSFRSGLLVCLSLFLITACGGGGGSDDDNNGDQQQDTAVTAPTNVSATGFEEGINISWSPVTGIGNYRVYYKASAGVTSSDPYFPAVGTGYNHTGLAEGDAYFYAVSAVNNSDVSELSSEVSASADGIPVPPQVTAKVMVKGGDTQAIISWEDAEGATSYNVYYKLGAGVNSSDTAVEAVTSPHTVEGLSNGSLYSFMVQSVNEDGAGESSEVTTISDVRMTITHHAPRLTSAASDGSQLVLVGSGGALYTSALDGSAKTAQDSGTEYDLYSVAYGANTFVATGATGVILTSSNGTSWQQSFSPTGGAMDKVIFANNQFYAIGQTAVLISSDGEGWTISDQTSAMCNSEVENDNYLQYIAFADDKLVVTATTGCMKVSTDNGVSWAANSSRSSDTEEFLGLTHNGSAFVALSRENGPVIELHTSSDGVSWSQATITDLTSPIGLEFAEGVFVTSHSDGDGLKYFSSSDGISWSEGSYSEAPTTTFQFIHHTGSDFISVGDNLELVISSDGLSWNNTSSEVISAEFIKVLHDGSQYLAISSAGGVYTSNDLAQWTLQISLALSSGGVTDVERVGNVLTLAGYSGFFGNSSNAVVMSHSTVAPVDYSTGWTSADVSNSGGINALAYDGIHFLAATRATIAYNGESPWENIENQPAFLSYTDIESDGTNIIALAGSTIYHHTVANYTDWLNVSTPSLPGTYSSLYEFEDNFYAFGGTSIASSTDGSSWSELNSAPISSSVLSHDGDKFISAAGNRLVSTVDFVTETLRGGRDAEFNGEIQIHDVFWDGSQLIMVGRDGFVATHPGY